MSTNSRSPLYELRLSAIGTIVSHLSPVCCGSCAPTSIWTTGRERIDEVARQDPGDETQGDQHEHRASAKRHPLRARRCATLVRGRPRNVMPNAFTKQAAASAAESASRAPIAGARNLSTHCGSWGLSRIAWKVSHSETNPLNGGSAEIAAEPMRKAKAVSGIR